MDKEITMETDWGAAGNKLTGLQVQRFIKDNLKSLHEKAKNQEERLEAELYEDAFNGHEYVDMGEAGIWATCNVGASTPEGTGTYFTWGETEEYPAARYGYDTYSKYNTSDHLIELEPEDDAAHVLMGGNWRMPTNAEFYLLIDLCDAEYVENYNGSGTSGWLFTLKTDKSKQLFFPFSQTAGWSYDSASYWSKTDCGGGYGYSYANAFYFSGEYNNFQAGYPLPRKYGALVRGIITDTKPRTKYITREEARAEIASAVEKALREHGIV